VPRSFTGLGRRVDLFIVAVVIASLGAAVLVGLIEWRAGHSEVNWTIFALITALLVITETRSSAWLEFGDGGVVTPSWTFTFALILLGAPTGAIIAMALTTVIADGAAGKSFHKVLFNTAQITLSLSVGALILFSFDIHGPLFADNTLAADKALAMILSGILVFVANGVIICRLLAFIEDDTFWSTMREKFALSMSADGAMLAMAPILLITAMNSLLLLPLIGTATFFVYQTARHAIQRSHEANHDPLTQLMNRRAFSSELEDFTQSAKTPIGSVFILDLDKFKDINDRLGHGTGDHVLQGFAKRIRTTLPDDAIVARLGGDEFAVLLPGIDDVGARKLAEDVLAAFDEPLVVDGFPISVGTSIGIATSPIAGSTSSELLHAADVAMYRAKRYRSGVEAYASLGSSRPRGRVALLTDLVGAIERDEFFLEYQPQIDLETHAIPSAEALLRWNHPSEGRIPPDAFIGLAEHTDLIGPITDWVIATALADLAPLGSTLGIAVNVSARNLHDRHFAERTIAALAFAGVAPERLEIEITESAASLEQDRTAVSIGQLRDAGVRVAIDDFGTGYSSFSTLRSLSADRIKIDRSFITNVTSQEADATIVRSVIDVAHGLGLDVVAEGVESADVVDLLRLWGCDIAQGFYFARPASPGQLRSLLSQHSKYSQADRVHILDGIDVKRVVR
jgi:diguanylate cyclase (GGDEF)-like protein